MRYVAAGDSKNAPARGARGGNASPGRGRAVQLSITCAGCPIGISRPRRSLRPSRVTASSGLRQCQVYGPRAGLAKSRTVAAPAAVLTPLSRMSGSQRSRAVGSADVAWRNGLLSHQHRSIGRRNHDDVTSSWSGPLQSHIVVVTRTTPSRVHALGRGYRAVQVAPRHLGTLGIDGAVSAAAGEVASGGAGTKQAAARGQWRSGRPRGGAGRCALWSGGALGQAVASARSSARLRVLLGSTGIPGPIVVVKVTFLRYRPLAAAGLSLITSSRAAA